VERLRSGAHLLQLYTGLIYSGPFLVRSILKALVKLCEREGLESIRQVSDTRAPRLFSSR